MASMTVSGQYRDFQRKVNGPYYEHLFGSCPVCHFAGFTSDFSQEVAVDIKEKVLKELKPISPGRKLGWIEQCEFAARIYEWQKKRNERIGDIYLIASYLCRTRGECGDSKRIKFQALACEYFIKALEANEIKTEGRWEISYLIADLYRRQGEFEKAIHWYDITLKEKNPDEFRETIQEQKEMARNRNADNDI
jgi:tetratricopeptide (TPR) repeat protein